MRTRRLLMLWMGGGLATGLFSTTCGGKLVQEDPSFDGGLNEDVVASSGNRADAEAGSVAAIDASDGGSANYGNAWLAFDSDRDGTRGIYFIRADGTGLVRFTTSAFVEKEPAFSPDGTKLAYTTNASGQYQIHIVDLKTSNSTQLTTRPYGAAQPAWSPDGNSIAFVGLPQGWDDAGALYPPPGVADLFIIRPDGTGEKDLYGPSPASYVWYPAYYPLTPAFVSDSHIVVFGSGSAIHAINVDGTGLRDIVGCPTMGTETPTMSPDAATVAFATWFQGEGIRTVSFAGYCPCPGPADPEDGVPACATVVVEPAQAWPQYAADRHPSWGANDVVAYEAIAGLGAPADIALVSASGGTPLILTTDSADDRDPIWAPSGFNP